jgi:hypothetical protein
MHRVPRVVALILFLVVLQVPVSASASPLPAANSLADLSSLCQPLSRLFSRLFGPLLATTASPAPSQPAARTQATPPTHTSNAPSAQPDGGSAPDPNGG